MAGIEAADDGLRVELEGGGESSTYDRVLVSVGRRANGGTLSAEAAGVEVDDRGQIATDAQMRTNVPWIYAIGDVTDGPMLAHKATHEGKVAAEAIAGDEGAAFDARTIPSVAYTDPEVAWMGLTETAAKAAGHRVREGRVPVVGVGPGDVAGPRRRHDQAAARARARVASWAPGSSASTPAI